MQTIEEITKQLDEVKADAQAMILDCDDMARLAANNIRILKRLSERADTIAKACRSERRKLVDEAEKQAKSTIKDAGSIEKMLRADLIGYIKARREAYQSTKTCEGNTLKDLTGVDAGEHEEPLPEEPIAGMRVVHRKTIEATDKLEAIRAVLRGEMPADIIEFDMSAVLDRINAGKSCPGFSVEIDTSVQILGEGDETDGD